MFWFPGFTLPPKPCAAGELRQQTDRGKQGHAPPRPCARNALRIRRAASLRSTPGIFSGACSKRKRSSRKIRGSHIARAERQKSSTRFPKSKAPDIFHGRCPGLERQKADRISGLPGGLEKAAFNAWSTGNGRGQRPGRTSCVPSCGHRGSGSRRASERRAERGQPEAAHAKCRGARLQPAR